MWQEGDSSEFIEYGRYFVPQRERQIDIICRLVPSLDQPIRILELACGEGLLAEALLARYPTATFMGLDGSEKMILAARQRLQPFGYRFQAHLIDLADTSWRNLEQRFHYIVSSLAIHHLDGPQKALLFGDAYRLLAPGGALIIADIIWPSDEQGRRLAADEWDEAVKENALKIDGTLDAFDHFQQARWNLFRYPDSVDKPSTVVEQLRWLEAVGFRGVDVHWLLAGHAIFGGLK